MGEPRDIIAAALYLAGCKRLSRADSEPQRRDLIPVYLGDADAVLAALTDAGITLCRYADLAVAVEALREAERLIRLIVNEEDDNTTRDQLIVWLAREALSRLTPNLAAGGPVEETP